MTQLAAEIRWMKGLQKGRVMLSVAAVTAAVLAVAIAGANLVSDELPPSLEHAIPALAVFEKNPYKVLYYYEADKQERYEAYQAANETQLTKKWRGMHEKKDYLFTLRLPIVLMSYRIGFIRDI